MTLLALPLALVSCQKQDADVAKEETAQMDETGGYPITFKAYSDDLDAFVQTKATPVTSLGSVYWLCSSGTAGNSAEAQKYNKTVSATSGTFTTGCYWPSTSTSYNYYLSNFQPTLSSGNVTVTLNNVNTDVVVGKSAAVAYKAVPTVTMNHILARLGTVTLSAPSGYTISNISLSIYTDSGLANAGVKTAGTYSISNNSWSASSTNTTQALAGSGSAQDIWLLPATYYLKATYTLTKGAYVETFTKKAPIALSQGKINTVTATVPTGNATEITFKVSVTAWGSQNVTATFS